MPRFYKYGCENCGELNWPKYLYCPYCGIEHDVEETEYVKLIKRNPSYGRHREFVIALPFQRLLSPLVQLNGYTWLADQIGVDESRVRRVMNGQKVVSTDLIDRWLIKLGLENARYDGSLDEEPTSLLPTPPPTKYFED